MKPRVVHSPDPVRRTSADRNLRYAWISVGLMVVGFVAAQLIGQGLMSMQGYDADESAPLGAIALAVIPAMVVMLLPAAAAVWFGLRARHQGRDSGLVPALLGGLLGAGQLALNLLGLLALLLGFE